MATQEVATGTKDVARNNPNVSEASPNSGELAVTCKVMLKAWLV